MLIPDFESKCFLDALPKIAPSWDVLEVKKAEGFLRERVEMVRAGVLRCPSWFQEELNKIDSRLRCWWDEWTGKWVIDRLQDEGIVEGMLRLAKDQPQDVADSIRASASGMLAEGAYYLTVLQFQPNENFQLDRSLLDALRKADMQRFSSPAEYLTKKREEAAKIEEANKKAGDEKIMAAVDSLSSKRLETFLKVHEAFETGETIIAHGEDAKFLQGIEDARRLAPPLPISKPSIFKKRKVAR